MDKQAAILNLRKTVQNRSQDFIASCGKPPLELLTSGQKDGLAKTLYDSQSSRRIFVLKNPVPKNDTGMIILRGR